MNFNFLDLPEDIHLEICVHVGPSGLLALKQTCRVLHALGCTNYVWNQMRIDLPLDLPFKSGIQLLPASLLQRAVIKALRLEHNWQHRATRIRQLKRIPCGNTIDQMQPLGSQWLVTLSRTPSLAQIAVWHVGGLRGCRVASVDTNTALRFSADLHTRSDVIIAVIEHNGPRNEHLNIYSLCLTKDTNGHAQNPASLELRHSVSKPLARGAFFDVHVCGHIVAAAVARFSDPASPPSYDVILVNVLTHTQWLFHPDFPLALERVRLKLSSDRVILVGVENNKMLMIRDYGLPLSILSDGPYRNDSATTVFPFAAHLPADIDDTDVIIPDRNAIQFPNGFDFHLSTESANGVSAFMPIVVFPSLIVPMGGLGYTINFPFSLSTPKKELTQETSSTVQIPMQQFSTPARTSADIVCVGKTGRRAVWMQRRWDNDEFEFMKATFSSSGESVMAIPLLPKHTPLPFEPHACQSLALDEAVGRLYISVNTGDLFILDL